MLISDHRPKKILKTICASRKVKFHILKTSKSWAFTISHQNLATRKLLTNAYPFCLHWNKGIASQIVGYNDKITRIEIRIAATPIAYPRSKAIAIIQYLKRMLQGRRFVSNDDILVKIETYF